MRATPAQTRARPKTMSVIPHSRQWTDQSSALNDCGGEAVAMAAVMVKPQAANAAAQMPTRQTKAPAILVLKTLHLWNDGDGQQPSSPCLLRLAGGDVHEHTPLFASWALVSNHHNGRHDSLVSPCNQILPRIRLGEVWFRALLPR